MAEPLETASERAATRYAEVDRHKCVTCGFYGTATPGDAEGVREVPLGFRKSGQLPGLVPVCIREAAYLFDELRAARDAARGDSTAMQATISLVTDKERRCPDWYPYMPGMSPHEHLRQMMQEERDRIDHEQRLRLAQMEHESRAAVAEAARINQSLQTEIRDLQRETKSFTTKWTRWAFALAFVAAVIAAVGVTFGIVTYYHVWLPLPTPTP